ncbi:protein NO VEIN domain-containing protein [Proteus terrae]|uniref:protein NO VEIN domain-containing protein n=1 Tax=Proteus terrae TaxID=1574161 RepID=UPI001C5F83AB|nr:DUF3883 domain-containing protein [Proteus terrae]
MYKIPQQFYQRLHHPRPRFKSNIENVLGYMAFSIVGLDGTDKSNFKKSIVTSIQNFPGNANLTIKTLNNWRTEITALFSMINYYNNKVVATDLSKELADTTNLREFFLRFVSTFQYPGGFLKSNEIEKIINSKIQFHPLLWLSLYFTNLRDKDDRYITDIEFCHCVLNDLRVTRDHEDISITIERIMYNRKHSETYESSGDIKRYALDILDYCVLAGLLLKDYNGKYFSPETSLAFFDFFKKNISLFNDYKKNFSIQEIENVKCSWIEYVNNYSASLLKEYNLFLNKKSNNVQIYNTKEIGDNGEALILEHEKIWLVENNRPELSKLVKHIPTQFAMGYDIQSRELDATMRHIEVKTTISQNDFTVNRVHLTPNEWSAAESHRERYFIYRVQISDKNYSLWILQDPVGLYKADKLKMIPRNGADIFFNDSCYKQVELLRTHE